MLIGPKDESPSHPSWACCDPLDQEYAAHMEESKAQRDNFRISPHTILYLRLYPEKIIRFHW